MKSSILSNKAIRNLWKEGEIIIEPFNEKNLGTNSYDVTLGEWYFREQPRNVGDSTIYNMYSKENVERIWGEPEKALPYSYYKEKGITLENIKDNSKDFYTELFNYFNKKSKYFRQNKSLMNIFNNNKKARCDSEPF